MMSVGGVLIFLTQGLEPIGRWTS